MIDAVWMEADFNPHLSIRVSTLLPEERNGDLRTAAW